jgi:hypothetical protein
MGPDLKSPGKIWSRRGNLPRVKGGTVEEAAWEWLGTIIIMSMVFFFVGAMALEMYRYEELESSTSTVIYYTPTPPKQYEEPSKEEQQAEQEQEAAGVYDRWDQI